MERKVRLLATIITPAMGPSSSQIYGNCDDYKTQHHSVAILT